jgi:hypothetical protein
MKREEFIKDLLNEGYEVWAEEDDRIVMGRVTYTDHELNDWEEWHIYTNKAVHYFATNRSVPGWTLCPKCGQWYQWSDERDVQWHEELEEFEVIYFD